jgi:hypothetical protein
MPGEDKKDLERQEIHIAETANVLLRLLAVETTVKQLQTEVNELQLAKRRFHGDD